MKSMFCAQVLGRPHSHIHSNDLHGVMGSGESRKRCNEHGRPSGPLILPGESGLGCLPSASMFASVSTLSA